MKIRRSIWIGAILAMLLLVAKAFAGTIQVTVDKPFDCLPQPWDKATVIDCTPSYEEGAVHLFCHFKIE